MTTEETRKVEQLHEQLEHVQDEIDEARELHVKAQARPEGHLWTDSGTEHPELDDQTIAPG